MKKYASLLAVMLVAVLLLAVPAGALAATSVSTAADLKTAVEAGESVVLIGDITLTESLKVSGKTLTIDLGGNTLSMPKGDNFFQADSDITITKHHRHFQWRCQRRCLHQRGQLLHLLQADSGRRHLQGYRLFLCLRCVLCAQEQHPEHQKQHRDPDQ